jgi:hypothetical protein
MEQWVQHRSKYLHVLLEMEGRPTSTKCYRCAGQADIKCPDCFCAPVFCRGCCLKAHRHSPFHRPLQWTATHYTQVSLQSLGFVLCLGHGGAPCPKTVEVWVYSPFNLFLCSYPFRESKQHKKPITAGRVVLGTDMVAPHPSNLFRRIQILWTMLDSFRRLGGHLNQRAIP